MKIETKKLNAETESKTSEKFVEAAGQVAFWTVLAAGVTAAATAAGVGVKKLIEG